jgi:hypothetical protein
MNFQTAIADSATVLLMIAPALVLILPGAFFGWRYRRRVERAMRKSRDEQAGGSFPASAPRLSPRALLALREIDATGADDGAAAAHEKPLRLALLAACVLHFLFILSGIWLGQTVNALGIYFFMSNEAVLVLLLLRAGWRAWAISALAYTAFGVAAFPALRYTSGVLQLLDAGKAILYPALGLLLLLVRPVRAAVLLLFGFLAFVLVQTSVVGVLVLITYLATGDVITPSTMHASIATQHRVLLAGTLTQVAAALVFFWVLRRESARRPVIALFGLAVSGLLVVLAAQALHRSLPLSLVAALDVPTVALAWFLSWICLQGLHRLRERGWISPEYDRCSVLWAYLSLIAWGFSGTWGGVLAAAAFPAAVIAHRTLMWRHWSKNGDIPGKRLVLLRVFGRPREATKLLESLRRAWRPIGSIDLILATDLASFDVSSAAFEAYLKGNFDASYLQTREDVDRGLATLDRRLGGDGYYPVRQWRCFASTWQYAVVKLIQGADAVLMDLRGFRESNLGCVFELTELVNLIDLDRILLLADKNTDRDALGHILERAWAGLREDSPNMEKREPVLRIASDPRALSNVLREPERVIGRARGFVTGLFERSRYHGGSV